MHFNQGTTNVVGKCAKIFILKQILKIKKKKNFEGEEEDENPISRTAAGENVEI